MESAPPVAPQGYARRTYLVDPGFQLKYTSILMVVGACITALFGAMMYQAHLAATQALGAKAHIDLAAMDAYDARLAWTVLAIAIVMTLALALFGVLVTHRVAGPLYVIARHLKSIGEGRFPELRPLRQRDELKEFFNAFQESVGQIREREIADLAAVTQILNQLEAYCSKVPGASTSLGASLLTLKGIRDRKQSAVGAPHAAT